MPLTLRDRTAIVQTMLTSVLAGGSVTDISPISVTRQLLEADAGEVSQLYYALYTLLQGWYIGSATGDDLRTRIRDMGGPIDDGQVASDPVTFTRVQTWLEDIALPAPQILQATLADGTASLYRSIGAAHLWPQGRSISGQAPGVIVTSGVTDQLRVNLDSDGARTLTLGTQTSGVAIAAAIQAAVRALSAITPGNQPAYDGFRCDYATTTAGAYTLRSGSTGPTSTVVVTASTANDGTQVLKLGLVQGGQEVAGQDSMDVLVLCDQLGVIGNVGAGQIQTQVSPVAGIQRVGNALAFANGREAASDDALRQNFRNYLLGLAGTNQQSIQNAVYNTIGSDGQRHVFKAQVAMGAGNLLVYVCDGRSLTQGAQADVLTDVENELLGLGQRVGGWLPLVTAGVIPARIRGVPIDLTVYVGPGVDKLLAQQALTAALYEQLYQWPMGTQMSYAQMTTMIRDTVTTMLEVTYRQPAQFTVMPLGLIEGVLGEKLMPSTLAIEVLDA